MDKKQQLQRKRVHLAAELARVAMRLQRTPADKQADLLRTADKILHNYKMTRILENQKPSGTFVDTVTDEATMTALADVIRENIAPHLFALLVFTKDPDDGGRTNYVSNCRRDDICAAMAEFIAANEERLMPGPKTKQ